LFKTTIKQLQVTPYTLHVTRHMSHVTHHTSQVTRYTSHVTRFSSAFHTNLDVQEIHCNYEARIFNVNKNPSITSQFNPTHPV